MARNIENVLIVLDYLLRKTDENHKSSANEINKYALEEYGVSIDRRSVKDLLEELKDLNDSYPEKFPFVLEMTDGERPKYYIEKRAFSKEEIISIGNSIKNDPTTPIDVSNELLKTFLNSATSDNDRDEILRSLEAKPTVANKVTKIIARKVDAINKAIRNKQQISYTSKYNTDKSKFETNYFYKIVYIGTMPYAIIIKDNKLVSMKVQHLKILHVHESWFDDVRCKFKIADEYKGDFATPEAEIKKTKLPGGKEAFHKCIFEFDNTQYILEHIKESFESFFHEDLVYTVKNNLCHVEFDCDAYLFLDWYLSYETGRLIYIIGDEFIKLLISTTLEVMLKNIKDRKYTVEFNENYLKGKNGEK